MRSEDVKKRGAVEVVDSRYQPTNAQDVIRMWMVRAGRGGNYIVEFRDNEIVGMGWDRVGDLSCVPQEEIRERVKCANPSKNSRQIAYTTKKLICFRYEIGKGDCVLSYDGLARVYLLGRVRSCYKFNKSPDAKYYHIRRVSWEAEVPRGKLSDQTNRKLVYRAAVFSIGKEQQAEIVKMAFKGGM